MINRKKLIIGIAGEKQSGKDTVAKMISYILTTSKPIYRDFIIKQDVIKTKDIIIHYADFLKDICSKMFNIERFLFDDNEYKENKYFLMDQNMFVSLNNITSDYIVITHAILKGSSLASLINLYKGKVAIKLRTLLQYVGTEVGKQQLHHLCWINPTIINAIDIKNKYGFCIIADVRFEDECEVIKSKIGGYVIKVNKKSTYESKDNHLSEEIDINPNFIITNDLDKMNLFYEVNKIIREMLK